MVKIESLSKHYAQTTALHNVLLPFPNDLFSVSLVPMVPEN